MNWVAASGAVGLESITIALQPAGKEERSYTVRLYFMEPEGRQAGERVFDIGLQGRILLRNVDVVAQAGGPNRALVREFKGIKVGKDLTVTLKPSAGEPVLSGIEVVAE